MNQNCVISNAYLMVMITTPSGPGVSAVERLTRAEASACSGWLALYYFVHPPLLSLAGYLYSGGMA